MPTKESKPKPKKNGSTARASALKTTRRPPAVQPGDDQIRVRAYEIYLERGYHGDPMEDWLRAERELIERTPVLATPPIARRRAPARKGA